MRPRVLMSEQVMAAVVAEMERVFPAEGIAVPLMAVEPRRWDHGPWAPLGLADIGVVVVARVLLVPPRYQRNQRARVSVLPRTDQLVNAEVQRQLGVHPSLWACGYLHSHPFAHGQTWPSYGLRCDYEGHMLPQLRDNREAGLDTSVSLIARRGRGGKGWVVQGFALDSKRQVVDLGPVTVVPNHHRAVRRALLSPMWSRQPAASILRRWRRQARRAGLAVRQDELMGGWWRVRLTAGDGSRMVGFVPPSFPRQPMTWFELAGEVHNVAA